VAIAAALAFPPFVLASAAGHVLQLRSLVLGLLVLGLLAMPARSRADQVSSDCSDAGTPYAEVQIDTAPRVEPLEIARTPEEHQVGLMYRQTLAPDGGMVFVYDHQATEGYWMHNTLVPLSIAWIDQNGSIVDIQDMQPQTDDVHTPAAPYWYALEVNQGWYLQHGVGVGQQIHFCLGS
jgi:uncharacterized membrane protein (UPF0127 family)